MTVDTRAAGAVGRSLTGSQRAAVLLVHLGRENASRVLAAMTETEVEEIAAEIVGLGAVDPELVSSVLDDFFAQMGGGSGMGTHGGVLVARDLLEHSLGTRRAESVMERVSKAPSVQPFAFLREADPRQLLNFLSVEHPQTIALVLAHLRPDQASTVLAGLDATTGADVAHRIGVMDRTTPEIVRVVAEVLHRRTSSVLAPVQESVVGGLQPLVEIINRADPGTEKLILEGLDERDHELADEVRSRMFVFDDVLGLEDRAVQLVLRAVETNVLATALKGAEPPVHEKITSNVSERARETLLEEIDLLGRVRLSQVEEARAAVVAVIRTLEATGEIVLRRGGDDADEYVG